ncbi:MAG TPA: aromatic amino acid ammonia-lyase [Bacteroidales bacterium]|nr:aromatic amino acid lyase [Bacteroidales bacterium]HOX79070.1 aromatic amino acid ammonia-lyase [Bacteroidales bacterium]HPI86215.1 aromatic amino acid ammonia-lyase [Bacteroidales bacterium]HPM92788.1 aromatic amino acid ammonia-lyase [Bacteroidales bacterium]
MIVIGGRDICLEDFQQIIFGQETVSLDPEAFSAVNDSFLFLKDFSKNKIIYGINTGLGPMSQYKVQEKDRQALQYNLIRSHAAGMGEPISEIHVKALMVARLNTLMKGYSGIHPSVVELLRDFINHDITPVIPRHGGVGASGDLVQLAHLALALIGEGEVTVRGTRMATEEALRKAGLEPVKMHIREALSLINGTSVMSGIGIVNVIRAKRLLQWAVAASALINEVVESYDDHFSLELNRVKLHPGQQEITGMLQNILADSRLTRKRAEDLFNGTNGETVFTKKIQEYYSLRCITQILGPVADTIHAAERVVLNEINSVNDNPVIDHRNGNVFHGGNFHGDYISLEMDKLKLAITKLSMLAERQLNFLMNDKLNGKLPPFVNLGTLGLNLGMQGTQFTATSTVAENQSLSNPVYIHSIPTNNDNQDIVSMGTNAALLTGRVIRNSFEVMSIHLLTLMQAVDHLKIRNRMSTFTGGIYDALRARVPAFADDHYMSPDLRKINEYISNNSLNI